MPGQLRSPELGGEADVPASHALEDDVDAAAAQHPLETVIPVLALEETGLDELRDHLEPWHASCRRIECCSDARAGASPLEPRGEPGARRRVTRDGGSVDEGDDRDVAP